MDHFIKHQTMETVQQHEWGYTVSPISRPKHRCCHCECGKVEDLISGRTIYVDKANDVFSEEPPCITRQITEDER